MSADDQQPRGPFVGCFAAAFVLTPLAYALSIGPAEWLHERGCIPTCVGVIYEPLVWLCGVPRCRNKDRDGAYHCECGFVFRADVRYRTALAGLGRGRVKWQRPIRKCTTRKTT